MKRGYYARWAISCSASSRPGSLAPPFKTVDQIGRGRRSQQKSSGSHHELFRRVPRKWGFCLSGKLPLRVNGCGGARGPQGSSGYG